MVLQNYFFFHVSIKKKLGLYFKPEKNPGDKLKKIQVCMQELKFFYGVK
jgi:hypothetical protein